MAGVEGNRLTRSRRSLKLTRRDQIVLCASRKVEEEFQNIISLKPKKGEKAEIALKWMKSVGPEMLPFRPAIYGEMIYGEAFYGQGYEFDKADLRDQDCQIAEFLTANEVQYFVSVDARFLVRIKGLLRSKGSSAVFPEDLIQQIEI